MFHGSQASVQPRVDTNHHPPSNQHLVAASILLQAHQGHPHGHHPVVQQQPPPFLPSLLDTNTDSMASCFSGRRPRPLQGDRNRGEPGRARQVSHQLFPRQQVMLFLR